jgi:hypothetical protein
MVTVCAVSSMEERCFEVPPRQPSVCLWVECVARLLTHFHILRNTQFCSLPGIYSRPLVRPLNLYVHIYLSRVTKIYREYL